MAKNAVRRKAGTSKARNLASGANKQRKFPRISRQTYLQFLVFAAFFGMLAVLVSPTVTVPRYWPSPQDYGTEQRPGYADSEFIAEVEYSTVDLARTEQERAEAAANVSPVYAFDGEALRNALLEVDKFLAVIKESGQKEVLTFEEKLGLLRISKVVPDRIPEDIAATWLKSVTTLGATQDEHEEPQSEGQDETAESEVAQDEDEVGYRFDELAQSVKVLLQGILEEGVITRDDVKQIVIEGGEQAQLELVKLRGDVKQKKVEVANLTQVAAARAEIQRRARKLYPDEGVNAAVGVVASQFITATIVADKEQTEKRRREAAAEVEPVKKIVRPGQLIIQRGMPWTRQAKREMEDYRKALDRVRGGQQRIRGSIGHTILLLLLMIGVARCLALVAPNAYSSLRHFTLMLLAITAMVGVARFLSVLDLSGYLVPVAAVPILLAILMGRRVGLLAGATLAVLVSMVYGNDWNVLTVVAAGSLAGVLGVVSVRKRGDLMRPGILVALVTIIVVVGLGFVSDTLRFSPGGLADIAEAAINGVLVTLIVPGTLSLFESAFKITTDIQLLELTDLNHPVLRRMTMEAPGTHHHSLMVGNLAEVAAEAIGANSLMVRVCSYYHDIGKLNRPEYFSENQTDYNRHDGLSPAMSSRIIARHVKDGLELAREYGLCQPVVDIIEQHHGTDVIRFFYEKALKEDKHNCVREEDFRYPGPKPQSREAAIVMVADSIESGSRSLTNLTRARLKAFADKIVNTRFADGQFDNCDLTLKDLHVIAESMVRALMSAHHKRIEYPEQEPAKLATNSRLSSMN